MDNYTKDLLKRLTLAVNTKRAKEGLPKVSQAFVIMELVETAANASNNFIGNVFISRNDFKETSR